MNFSLWLGSIKQSWTAPVAGRLLVRCPRESEDWGGFVRFRSTSGSTLKQLVPELNVTFGTDRVWRGAYESFRYERLSLKAVSRNLVGALSKSRKLPTPQGQMSAFRYGLMRSLPK